MISKYITLCYFLLNLDKHNWPLTLKGARANPDLNRRMILTEGVSPEQSACLNYDSLAAPEGSIAAV